MKRPNLERHKLTKFTQEVVDNLNSYISTKNMKYVVENSPRKKPQKLQAQMSSLINSTKHSIQSLPQMRRG